MEEIEITKHAYDRAKERLGWKKGTLNRMVKKAYDEGIDQTNSKGRLRRYLDAMYFRNLGHTPDRATICKIYGEVIYIFRKERLITLFQIDNKLKKHLKY